VVDRSSSLARSGSFSEKNIGLSSEMSSSLVHSFFPSEMEEKFRVGLIILLSSVYGTFK